MNNHTFIRLRSLLAFASIAIIESGTSAAEGAIVIESIRSGTEDLEFRIVSTIGGSTVLGPSTLETGYNGAYVLPSRDFQRQGEILGIAQSFSVLTTRGLLGVDLRIGRFGPATPTGTFEVAIHEFDSSTSNVGLLIASTSVSAALFHERIGSANSPYRVNFAGSVAVLKSGEDYLLSLISTGGFGRTAIAPHAATDIYAGGNSYLVFAEPIPEPSIGVLAMIALSSFTISNRRRN